MEGRAPVISGDPAAHLFASSVDERVDLMHLHGALGFTWAALQAGLGFQEHAAIGSDCLTSAALLSVALCIYNGKRQKENEAESFLINLSIRRKKGGLFFRTDKSSVLCVCVH